MAILKDISCQVLGVDRYRRIEFMKARDLFTTIRTEGGLLTADLLQRLVLRDKDLP